MRAPTDAQRDAWWRHPGRAAGAHLRAPPGVRYTHWSETMRAAAAPSAPLWQQRWERRSPRWVVPLHRMPSGAGHDAMKLHEVMPQAMLFVRGQNAGISHNPLEEPPATTCSWPCEAFQQLLEPVPAGAQSPCP
jgi:N-carbamoyl-L-amino-acid hydrolase